MLIHRDEVCTNLIQRVLFVLCEYTCEVCACALVAGVSVWVLPVSVGCIGGARRGVRDWCVYVVGGCVCVHASACAMCRVCM